jgi:hypothetical protein
VRGVVLAPVAWKESGRIVISAKSEVKNCFIFGSWFNVSIRRTVSIFPTS